MEESGLTLEHFIDEFVILSPPNTVDHVFIAKAPENPQVTLNNEHTEFNWLGLDEIKNLGENAVPMLYDCVELAVSKMNEKQGNISNY